MCAKPITVYTHAQAKYISCANCGAYYRFNAGEFQFIKKAAQGDFKYALALGTKGIIEGYEYTVVSAAERIEGKALVAWREVTLFNPIKGYLYLSEYQGHWILMHQIDKAPSFNPTTHELWYNKFLYRIYDKYKPNLNHSAGEFTYDIVNGPRIEVTELINPPTMLSREYTATELRWYYGKHMETSEVSKIFNVADLPKEQDVGLLQPQTFSLHYDTLVRITIIAAIVFFMVQLCFHYTSQDVSCFTYSGTVNSLTNNQPVTTPSFQLKGGTKNLIYHLVADVDNQWIETGAILVNDKTGQSFDFAHGVEYYHGYEDGETWSEGARDADKIIEAVPEGTYHLVLSPQQDINSPTTNYSIDLRRDVPRWSNLLKALVVMSIIPFVQFYRSRIFEKNRWSDSYYTPYKNEE